MQPKKKPPEFVRSKMSHAQNFYVLFRQIPDLGVICS